jgi:hypothetical protein
MHDPFWSVVLISLVDIVACFPTIRQAYHHPWREPAMTYGICALRSLCAVAAVDNYAVATTLYPLAMTLSNGFLALALIWWRSKAPKAAPNPNGPSLIASPIDRANLAIS